MHMKDNNKGYALCETQTDILFCLEEGLVKTISNLGLVIHSSNLTKL